MPASDRRTNWLVVGPVLLYTGLLLLGPIVAVVAGAFVEGAGALAGEGVGGRVNAGFDGDHGACLWFRDGWIANHGAPHDNRNRSDCA